MSYSIISGAIIDSINGTSVRYRAKCDNCGNIQGGFSSSTSPIITGAFVCDKCKTHNKILIKKIGQ
jgi:hypothetical protein